MSPGTRPWISSSRPRVSIKRKAGNVILIAPTDEIAAREKLELEARKQVEELERLRTEFIKVNYAKAADMADLLKLTDNAILSPRGSVSVDERTNTLLVKDTNSSLANVRVLLAELDIPVRQVLIESRVVIANDDFSKELGVRFGVSRDSRGRPSPVTQPITSGTLAGVATRPMMHRWTRNSLNVNLPVQNPAGSFALALAKLPLGTLLEMELSAAQIEGRGEVVSSPRVITADSHTARIEQGVEIPYLELDDGDATLKFRKAVLSLEVTPQITPDDRVIMDLDVHKDNVGETFLSAAACPHPVSTPAKCSHSCWSTMARPWYSAVSTKPRKPARSRGYRSSATCPSSATCSSQRSRVDDRTELLIFVTPKILQGSNLDVR